MIFRDRNHAGESLASLLVDEWKEKNPVVVALPRGGAPDQVVALARQWFVQSLEQYKRRPLAAA